MDINVNEKNKKKNWLRSSILVSYDILFKHMRIQTSNPGIFLSPHPQQTSVATQTPLRTPLQ